jgi:hypothetical protein
MLAGPYSARPLSKHSAGRSSYLNVSTFHAAIGFVPAPDKQSPEHEESCAARGIPSTFHVQIVKLRRIRCPNLKSSLTISKAVLSGISRQAANAEWSSVCWTINFCLPVDSMTAAHSSICLEWMQMVTPRQGRASSWLTAPGVVIRSPAKERLTLITDGPLGHGHKHNFYRSPCLFSKPGIGPSHRVGWGF